MNYEVKNEILSILTDLRSDIGAAGERLRDGRTQDAGNLLGDISRDCEVLRGLLQLGRRHKVPDNQPGGPCVDLKTPAAVDLQAGRATGL